MIDLFALFVIHVLLALAMLRLMKRDDLDADPPAPDPAPDPAPNPRRDPA